MKASGDDEGDFVVTIMPLAIDMTVKRPSVQSTRPVIPSSTSDRQ